MEASETYALRALSIGEIFDRAITIYVRHFVPLTLIVLTLIVPLTAAQGYLFRDQARGISAILNQMQHPSSVQPMSPGEIALLFIVAFVSLMLAPIVNDAVAVGVANVYNNKAPQYARCFATVLPRIVPLLGTTVLEGLMLFSLYMASVVVIVLVMVVGIAFVKVALPLAVVVFLFTAVLALAVVAVFVGLFIGFAFATYATVLERVGPVTAIGGSFRRLFNRAEFRKVLLMGLATFALNIGVLMLSGTVTLLIESVISNQAIELAINAVISSMSTAFITVLLAVYYYDVRTRSEGLDLEVDLARLTAAS